MSTLDRYLFRNIVLTTALVLLVFLALAGFVNFAGQVDKVGQGSYTLQDALVFVALSLPRQAYEMLPVSALLGALLGLGMLASGSELTAMRAAGVSVWRLARSVAIAGAFMMLLGAALGEFIAPPAEQYAERFRAQKLHRDIGFGSGQSGWIKDGEVIINVGRLRPDGSADGVRVYRFDDEGRIASIATAAAADVSGARSWTLNDLRESRFVSTGVEVRNLSQAVQPSNLSADLLRLAVVDPEELSAHGLFRYVRYLRSNALASERYETALWSRFSNTLAILIMSVLALPFVFGSLRSTGAGSRLIVGVLLGVGWYLGSRTLASSGAVYGLDPLVTAWAPSGILLLLTAWMLARVR